MTAEVVDKTQKRRGVRPEQSRKAYDYPKECRPPIVDVQEIVEDGREMPVVKDDAAVQQVEVRQGQNAKEQAEHARTTNFDEEVYNFKALRFRPT